MKKQVRFIAMLLSMMLVFTGCGPVDSEKNTENNKNSQDIKNGYVIGGILGKKTHAVLSRIGGKQAYFSSFSTIFLIQPSSKGLSRPTSPSILV